MILFTQPFFAFWSPKYTPSLLVGHKKVTKKIKGDYPFAFIVKSKIKPMKIG
jgi:hypothetical protein